ncbi:MAG: hypothetical protein NTW38_08125 [Candidatus Aminicenantes bacterium]|nr:hypothetical protein [Candidatus Aminicenantes bacterium]
MSAHSRLIAVFFLGAGILLGPFAAPARETERSFRIQAGVGAEVFSRSIVWDERTGSSILKVGLGMIRVGLELPGGASFALLAGYGGNNWNGLVFRELPFSIDYEAGSLGAILLGTDIDVPLFKPGKWEIGASGRFLFSFGSSGEWTLTGLQQIGAFDGRANGLMIQAGPTLTYRGFETFSPFATLFYDGLSATFTMNENIDPLVGTEKKKIKGQGAVGASVGILFEPSPAFRLKAEGFLVPYTKLEGGLKFNVGASLRTIYLF